MVNIFFIFLFFDIKRGMEEKKKKKKKQLYIYIFFLKY